MPDFKAKNAPKSISTVGSAPDPAEGVYSVPRDPLAGFKGSYF